MPSDSVSRVFAVSDSAKSVMSVLVSLCRWLNYDRSNMDIIVSSDLSVEIATCFYLSVGLVLNFELIP